MPKHLDDDGDGSRGNAVVVESNSLPRASKYPTLPHSDPNIPSTVPVGAGAGADDDPFGARNSSASAASPGYFSENMSPFNPSSPYAKSPWTHVPVGPFSDESGTFAPATGLIGSLVREEGHIYSLAAAGDLLYTGSDSKNIRVWKNQKEYSGFKSHSGLVKAIVIAGDRIFTGHQDGKIRVWGVSSKDPTVHKRIGTLPTFRHLLRCSLNPSNYVEVRRHRSALWIRHSDAISCLSLSLSENQGLLYSGSWDKTFKVWRISDSKCLESVRAHNDAVNAVVAGFEDLVFTGSADGTVKVWQRELQGKGTKHSAVQTLLEQDSAVTSLAVNPTASVVYCGSSDGLVNFWDMDKQLTYGGVLRGHKMAVLCLAAAGPIVLSGSMDKTICVWRRDGVAHSCLSVLSGHAGPVKCLAVEADKASHPADPRWLVYSGSLDKSVKMWRVSELPTGEYLYPHQPPPQLAAEQQEESGDGDNKSGY